LSENIEIPIVSTDFIKDAFRVVPLVENRLDKIQFGLEPEPDWPFIGLSARVALDPYVHRSIPDPMTNSHAHALLTGGLNQRLIIRTNNPEFRGTTFPTSPSKSPSPRSPNRSPVPVPETTNPYALILPFSTTS
jgi:hypothetical protein